MFRSKIDTEGKCPNSDHVVNDPVPDFKVKIMVEVDNDDIVEFTIWKRIFQGLVISLDDTCEDVMEKIETKCLNKKVDVHFNSSGGSNNVVVLCIKEW